MNLGSIPANSDMIVADVSVPETRDETNGQVLYEVRVRCQTGQDWVVKKRFGHFAALEARTSNGRGRMPDFPSWSNFDFLLRSRNDIIEHRRAALENWIRALVIRAHQNPILCPALMRWLEVDSHLSFRRYSRRQRHPSGAGNGNGSGAPVLSIPRMPMALTSARPDLAPDEAAV